MLKFFEEFPEITAVMSTREDGNMRINYCEKEKISTNGNRKKFFSKLGLNETEVASALLEHGNNIQVVGSHMSTRFFPNTDALVTKEKGLYLSVTAADCYPVLFYDPVNEIVSVAHVGWRGAVSGLLAKTVAYNLIKGSNQVDLRVVVGPGICQKHFEFERADLHRLGAYNDEKYYRGGSGEKVCVDIKQIICDELVGSGVLAAKIKFSVECTVCHPEKYFSARRDRRNIQSPVENMAVILGMKAKKEKKREKIWAKNFAFA